MTDETLIPEVTEPQPEPLGYVTFLPDGTLDGSYFQVPPEEHAGRLLEVDEGERQSWVLYRANAARDALELLPAPESAAPPVPQQVTMRQARLALLGAGLLGSVDAAIDSLPSPQKEEARIEWDYSSTVERTRPLVAMLGAALALEAAALDALFVTAAGL